MTEKDYWERFGFWRCRLSDIYTHIKSGMAETENPHCRKGIIVEKDADTESRLDFVKDYLNVSLRRPARFQNLQLMHLGQLALFLHQGMKLPATVGIKLLQPHTRQMTDSSFST